MIYLLRLLLIGSYTVILGVPAICLAPFDRDGRRMEAIIRVWVRLIFRTCRIRVEVEGLDHIDRQASYVVMSNHQSHLDVGALFLTLPIPLRFVAKKELTRIPVFGQVLVLAGHVIIDRSDTNAAVRSLQRAAERIRTGTNVVIFPEGTRSDNGTLGDFRSGGFHLALQAGVPVLPISVSGSRRLTPKGSFRVESGTLKVAVGPPIPTAHYDVEHRKHLVAEVRAAIGKGLDPAFHDESFVSSL